MTLFKKRKKKQVFVFSRYSCIIRAFLLANLRSSLPPDGKHSEIRVRWNRFQERIIPQGGEEDASSHEEKRISLSNFERIWPSAHKTARIMNSRAIVSLGGGGRRACESPLEGL